MYLAASPYMGAYTASKFAVRGLTQAAGIYRSATLSTLLIPYLALEFGPHRITVNAYAPGPIDTDMRTDSSMLHYESLNPPAVHYLDTSSAEVNGTAPGSFIGVVSCLSILSLALHMYRIGKGLGTPSQSWVIGSN
jgi:NAD(P)-dependent dehydrogenase (short-subunit alcohol dehydrogenase family)